MRNKENPIVIGTIIGISLGMIFFGFQSCKKEPSSAEQSTSRRISGPNFLPFWSPDGQKIAFTSARYGNQDIFVMNADGSNLTRLTNHPARDSLSFWSPDSQKIAFLSDRHGNRNLHVMNADGSNLTRLTNHLSDDVYAMWTPDGEKIVFRSDRNKNMDIYKMNEDGTDLKNLTDNPASDSWAFLSSDGQRIALCTDRDGNMEIYSMNLDGSDMKRLTDNPENDRMPSWSPDGKKIVYVSGSNRNQDIYIMNADGSDKICLTKNPARYTQPRWSPDGKKISFTSFRDGNSEIYTMNTDGSDQTRLTYNPASEGQVSWSPDGKKIVFGTNRDFDLEVYVMDADGSNPVNLTKTAPLNKAAGLVPFPQSELDLDEIPYKIVFETFRETKEIENWEICLIDAAGSNLINLTNTPEIDEMYPHASPDGSLICFVADEGKDIQSKRRNVYYMNIDGSNRVKVAENAYQPCWSADGKYIAYLPGEFAKYDRNSWANKGLEIYDIETKEVKKHPNDEISHIFNICWSPDGEWFVARGKGAPNVLFGADDNTYKRLMAQGCRPDISPDGKRIAWNRTDWNIVIGKIDFESSQSNVYDHTTVAACERDHEIYHVDWSPDGNYLTFSYWPGDGTEAVSFPAPGGNICVCDLRTGKWTQITTDGKHNKEPDWVPVQKR